MWLNLNSNRISIIYVRFTCVNQSNMQTVAIIPTYSWRSLQYRNEHVHTRMEEKGGGGVSWKRALARYSCAFIPRIYLSLKQKMLSACGSVDVCPWFLFSFRSTQFVSLLYNTHFFTQGIHHSRGGNFMILGSFPFSLLMVLRSFVRLKTKHFFGRWIVFMTKNWMYAWNGMEYYSFRSYFTSFMMNIVLNENIYRETEKHFYNWMAKLN